MIIHGKLGCLPPKQSQQNRLLQVRHYIDASKLPTPPASTAHRGKVKSWPMMLNDRLGCCTCSSVGHMQQEMSTLAGQPFVPTDAQILAAYSAVSGYDPRTGANDNGAVIVDVLNFWRKTGIGGHQLYAYMALNLANKADLCDSIYLFGAVKTGVQLPLAWQQSSVWDAPTRVPHYGKWAKGSWGGHDVPIVDYDANYLYAVSWGQIVPVTWRAWGAYFVEGYACLDKLWVNSQSKSPDGFLFNDLISDLALA